MHAHNHLSTLCCSLLVKDVHALICLSFPTQHLGMLLCYNSKFMLDTVVGNEITPNLCLVVAYCLAVGLVFLKWILSMNLLVMFVVVWRKERMEVGIDFDTI